MDWYDRYWEDVVAEDRNALLSSIAACQQWLFRQQDELGVRDRAQNDLFKQISKDTTGWIQGLDPKTHEDLLDEIADKCEQFFNAIRSTTEEEIGRADKQARKDAAVQAVEDSGRIAGRPSDYYEHDQLGSFSSFALCSTIARPQVSRRRYREVPRSYPRHGIRVARRFAKVREIP